MPNFWHQTMKKCSFTDIGQRREMRQSRMILWYLSKVTFQETTHGITVETERITWTLNRKDSLICWWYEYLYGCPEMTEMIFSPQRRTSAFPVTLWKEYVNIWIWWSFDWLEITCHSFIVVHLENRKKI